MNIVIIGAGQFGTALSQIYSKKGLSVLCLNETNPTPKSYSMSDRKTLVILCVPTQKIPDVVRQRFALLSRSFAVITTAKGFIQTNHKTAAEFIESKLPRVSVLALSGPSFASDLTRGLPTAVVLAGRNRRVVDQVSEFISTPLLRIYKSHDPKGIEICGALKNVYAIAAGITDGMKLGDSARAALTTRALAEMTRIGVALGAKKMTCFGLAGVGDLFLTCSSRHSRNYRFGIGLATGKPPRSLLKKLGTVEGVWTAEVAQAICRKHRLRSPILDLVVSLLRHKRSVRNVVNELMSREIRHEFD